MLHGPPGTGKTLLAKAVAHESGAKFFGQSASVVRRDVRRPRRGADPAPVQAGARERAGDRLHRRARRGRAPTRGSDISGERDQTLNQLLVEMDGFDSGDNVVVMAASNLLEKLDPALLRPGRFDRQVFVPPPDMRGREAILRVHTRDKPLAQDVDLDRVARHTSGLTGADLANLANEAAILAGRNRRDFITQRDFENAFERVVAGLQSRKVITDHEKRVIAWHEAGHALVSELLPSVDKVQKVSIIPRGKALGYTLNLPQEDRYLKSREELIDYMKVLLAGPRLGADHLRPRHHRRLRRPRAGDPDRPLDGLRVRDGHDDPLPSGPRRRLHGLRGAAPDARRGGPGARRGGLPRRPPAADRPPRPARRDRRRGCSPTRSSSTTRSARSCPSAASRASRSPTREESRPAPRSASSQPSGAEDERA